MIILSSTASSYLDKENNYVMFSIVSDPCKIMHVFNYHESVAHALCSNDENSV